MLIGCAVHLDVWSVFLKLIRQGEILEQLLYGYPKTVALHGPVCQVLGDHHHRKLYNSHLHV